MNIFPIKLNLSKALLAIYCQALSLLFLFSIRRFALRAVGNAVGSGTTIHRRLQLMSFGGINIGSNSTINFNCLLDGRGGLTIENNVNISHFVKIYTMGHNLSDPLASTFTKPVRIKNYAWIFPNVLIMPGVVIEEGSVIYPGSVVTKSTEPFGIYAGNPAARIGTRNNLPTYRASFPVWFGV